MNLRYFTIFIITNLFFNLSCKTFAQTDKNTCHGLFVKNESEDQNHLKENINLLIDLYLSNKVHPNSYHIINHENINQNLISRFSTDFISSNNNVNNTIQNKIIVELKKLKNTRGEKAVELFYQELNRRLQLIEKQKNFSKNHEDKETNIDKTNPEYWSKKSRFHLVEPGRFQMPLIDKFDNPYFASSEISESFELMATPVTQLAWSQLRVLIEGNGLRLHTLVSSKINPSNNYKGPDNAVIEIEMYKVEMNPKYPVEKVSYSDIRGYGLASEPPTSGSFLHGLNELSKSQDTHIQKILKMLLPGHQPGDIYDLPTIGQYVFTFSNRGKLNKKFIDQDDPHELEKYGWQNNNFNFQTYPVASKLPRLVNNDKSDDVKPFFDLDGGVKEWVRDLTTNDDLPQMQGKDPLNDFRNNGGEGKRAMIIGVTNNRYEYVIHYVRNLNTHVIGHDGIGIGFRMVRTRHVNKTNSNHHSAP